MWSNIWGSFQSMPCWELWNNSQKLNINFWTYYLMIKNALIENRHYSVFIILLTYFVMYIFFILLSKVEKKMTSAITWGGNYWNCVGNHIGNRWLLMWIRKAVSFETCWQNRSRHCEVFCKKGFHFCQVPMLWTLVDLFWMERLFSE